MKAKVIVPFFFLLGGHAQAQWIQRPQPVLRPTLTWEGRSVQEPTVYWDHGHYRMWYTGSFGNPCHIGYASSRDGIHWHKHRQPLINNACHNNIVRTRRGWAAFFASDTTPDLYIAHSQDGIHFTRRRTVLKAAGWAENLSNSYAWHDKTGWHLIYEARTANGSWQIGLAVGHRFAHWKPARRPLALGLHGLTDTTGGPDLAGRCLYFHAARRVILPTNIYRRCTHDFTHWTPAAQVLHRQQRWQFDQIADPSLAHHLMFFDGVNNVTHTSYIGVASSH